MTNARSSVVRSVFLVGLIYAINLALIPLNSWEIGSEIASYAVKVGLPRLEWLINAEGNSTMGFFCGESGCLALWLNLSTLRMKFRIPLYLVAVAQMTLLLMWISENLYLNESIAFLCIPIGLLLVTSIALRLSASRLQFVKIGREVGESKYRGVSISQLVFATAIVAIALAAAPVFQENPSTEPVYFAIFVIFVVCAVGLLPTVGLLITTSLRRLPMQIVACLVASFVAAVIVEDSSRWSWDGVWESCFVMIWVVSLPVVCVRIAKRLGYEVRYIDRNKTPNTDHPFDDRAAKEIE